MVEADLSFAEVYTLVMVKEQLLSAQEEIFSGVFAPLADNKTAAKILAKLSSVDVKKVYLSIAKDLIG